MCSSYSISEVFIVSISFQIDLDITGQVEATIDYDDSKLFVHIHQATGLKPADKTTGLSNPYIRCYVTGVPNREETQVRFILCVP